MQDESALDSRIRGYDWRCAFECCGPVEDDGYGHNTPSVSAALGSHVSAEPFGRADVARVLAASDGENDGPNWLGVFELRDGRFAFLSAGCDYTGWDCQSGGSAIVSHSLEHLMQFGLTEDARERLDLGRPEQVASEAAQDAQEHLIAALVGECDAQLVSSHPIPNQQPRHEDE